MWVSEVLLNRMSEHLTWTDILIRIFLTVIAASLIGIDRERGGHAAGFRTTVLVGLAACVAMLQANALLIVDGNDQSGFARMDILRFALGVLTGVGFIGGGTVLHRGNLVTGVTTAATIWAMTTIGLCFGGGQLGIGIVGTVVAFFFLSPMKAFDDWLPRRHRAKVELLVDGDLSAEELNRPLGEYRCDVQFASSRLADNGRRILAFDLRWRSRSVTTTEKIYRRMREDFDVVRFSMYEHGT
ncbi:MgtC/SapB family protein [Rhizobium sp. Root708]|uniref:MgtC/SapB family protein n=1 Tax=Rhizobium sp. Root708 TaxID=1736592 RepID=UPI000A5CFDBE|nr:MgtC/SapB family protein [Rhizobium sp. Root708]